MASKLVQITDVDKAWELWEAGLLVNVNGRPWFSIDEMLEEFSDVRINISLVPRYGSWQDVSAYPNCLTEQFPVWLAPKPGGGGYVYVETDEDC